MGVLDPHDLVDAQTALRIGLVHEVRDDLAARIDELLHTLTSRARVSLLGAKALIARINAGDRHEDESVVNHYDASLHGSEYAEGVAAFLRQPDFRAARATGR